MLRLIHFTKEEADMITDCYKENKPMVPRYHRIHHQHLKPSMPRILDDIDLRLDDPNKIDQQVEFFFRDFLKDPLREPFLSYKAIFVLIHCTNILLRHNCRIFGGCKKYLNLIMKLRVFLLDRTSLLNIEKDFEIIAENKLDSIVTFAYFFRFLITNELQALFFRDFSLNVLEHCTITSDNSFKRKYLFEKLSHFYVIWGMYDKLQLIINYGARNYPSHRTLYKFIIQIEFNQMGHLNIQILTRIHLRAVQVFLLYRHKQTLALQMVMAANDEPYLTEEQYKAAFTEIGIIGSVTQDELNESWNWYKETFEIKENATMTPRTLQHFCRFVIRLDLSWKGVLPQVIEKLPIIKRYKMYLNLNCFLITRRNRRAWGF